MKNKKGTYLESEVASIEFSELGEGLDGKYNPEDPADCELLHLDVLIPTTTTVHGEDISKEGWLYAPNGSVCTSVKAESSVLVRERYLFHALSAITEAGLSEQSFKRVIKKLAWMGVDPNFEDGEKRCRFCGSLCGESCAIEFFAGTENPYVCPTCWGATEEV